MTQKQTLTKPEEIKKVIPLAGGRQLPMSRPLVMGVLNVTPDSFSDGGVFCSVEEAVEHALRMVAEGADIIDAGGESARPGAVPVEQDVEMRRVIPVIEQIRKRSDVCISIDTYRAATARAAIDAGADMINDISALRLDASMVELVAESNVPVVLMHMQGTPRHMQEKPYYVDCIGEITAFFGERIEFCRTMGVDKTKLILDPGIGFGKRLSDNLEILVHLGKLKKFRLPLMIGVSRKSFIGMLHPASDVPKGRIGGSIAAAVAAVESGADILRVHDVGPTVEAMKIIQAIGAVR